MITYNLIFNRHVFFICVANLSCCKNGLFLYDAP